GTEDQIGMAGRRSRCRCGFATVFLAPSFGLGGVAIVDREIVATFFADMPRHRIAHHAQTDPRYLGHCRSSLCLPWATIIGSMRRCQRAKRRRASPSGRARAQLPARMASATTWSMVSKLDGTPTMAAASSAAAPDRASRTVLMLIGAVSGVSQAKTMQRLCRGQAEAMRRRVPAPAP